MNTTTKILSTIVLTFTGLSANAAEFVATDKAESTNLCVTAANGNKMKLNHMLKNSHLNKSFIIENVKCNDLPFLAFVEQQGNQPEKIIAMMTRGQRKGNVEITDLTMTSK